MKLDLQDIIIGLIAGTATAILCLGVASGSGLSVLLYLLSAVPIIVAGLGWGLGASIISVVVSSIAVLLVANQQTAVFIILTTALPAALTAYLLTLSRPADEIGGPQGQVAWYPLSDVLLRLCLIVGSAFILIGVMIGYGQELMQPVLDELVVRLEQSNPEFSFTPEARIQFDSAMIGLMPFLQPAMWVIVLVSNLYLGLKITHISGQLRRPIEIFPITLRMPKLALVPFGIAILVSLAGGGLGLAGTALCGAFFAGFMLAGFALFHAYSMGKPWRLLAMILVYVATLITMLPPIFMFFIGLFSLTRTVPTSPPHTN